MHNPDNEKAIEYPSKFEIQKGISKGYEFYLSCGGSEEDLRKAIKLKKEEFHTKLTPQKNRRLAFPHNSFLTRCAATLILLAIISFIQEGGDYSEESSLLSETHEADTTKEFLETCGPLAEKRLEDFHRILLNSSITHKASPGNSQPQKWFDLDSETDGIPDLIEDVLRSEQNRSPLEKSDTVPLLELDYGKQELIDPIPPQKNWAQSSNSKVLDKEDSEPTINRKHDSNGDNVFNQSDFVNSIANASLALDAFPISFCGETSDIIQFDSWGLGKDTLTELVGPGKEDSLLFEITGPLDKGVFFDIDSISRPKPELTQLEIYISQNKHLPNLNSAFSTEQRWSIIKQRNFVQQQKCKQVQEDRNPLDQNN